ncbi:hypothetical protein FB563_7592 [Streptomyces puniciscabiei]|uniref:Uncharacterized protein n=1 Tax=Streptomyces puniciscabiei TaxID=164348 RepID=A0A542SYX0_9ACTN|nr:hypothetical protein [Streptomyces puniciscabiei]TQK79742.1 hypothetical protein FB563_7592 [Streptomyces puniciscabiei]
MEAVHDLVAAYGHALQGRTVTGADRLTAALTRPGPRPEDDTVLVHDGTGVAAGHGWVKGRRPKAHVLAAGGAARRTEVRDPPAGVTVRPFRHGDERAAYRLTEDAFGEWQPRRKNPPERAADRSSPVDRQCPRLQLRP